MANIEYGESFEFNDWFHYYIDRDGTQYKYNTHNPTVEVTNESGFITPYALKITSGYMSYWGSGPATPLYQSTKSLKYTFCTWCKYTLNFGSTSTSHYRRSILGFITNASSRGFVFIGFYPSYGFDTAVIAHHSGSNLTASNLLATIPLPNNGTILNQWHHFAMCNDCETTYFFIDGKMVYSEPTVEITTWNMYNLHNEPKPAFQDFYAMTDVCLWTEDFEVPDAPLYEKYTMKNIGGSGWVPPTPPNPVTNILKVY